MQLLQMLQPLHALQARCVLSRYQVASFLSRLDNRLCSKIAVTDCFGFEYRREVVAPCLHRLDVAMHHGIVVGMLEVLVVLAVDVALLDTAHAKGIDEVGDEVGLGFTEELVAAYPVIVEVEPAVGCIVEQAGQLRYDVVADISLVLAPLQHDVSDTTATTKQVVEVIRYRQHVGHPLCNLVLATLIGQSVTADLSDCIHIAFEFSVIIIFYEVKGKGFHQVKG